MALEHRDRSGKIRVFFHSDKRYVPEVRSRTGRIAGHYVDDYQIEIINGSNVHINWLNIEISDVGSRFVGFAPVSDGAPSKEIREHVTYKTETYTFDDIAPNQSIKRPIYFSADQGIAVTGSVYGEFASGEDFQLHYHDTSSWCFVTTAAFGADHWVVKEFKSLRDEVLDRYRLGKSFIDWYYRVGPRMAATIEDRPWLQATTRTALKAPAYAVHYGRRISTAIRRALLG